MLLEVKTGQDRTGSAITSWLCSHSKEDLPPVAALLSDLVLIAAKLLTHAGDFLQSLEFRGNNRGTVRF